MAPATATLAPSAASELSARLTTPALANVLYEKKDAIAYVTVNRPKVLNALNTPTWEDLRTAFEDARDDATVLRRHPDGRRRQGVHRGRRHQRARACHRDRRRTVEPLRPGCA